jgi:DNA-binding response OmpR family regulator
MQLALATQGTRLHIDMQSAGAERNWEKRRVLVIDDDQRVLRTASDFLKAKGFEVLATQSVFEIPRLIGDFRPDLVVLDIRMPALSGEGVATTLKRMCDLPIVFYSAVVEDEGRAMASQYPGAVFVSKADGVRGLSVEVGRMLDGKATV